jgi:hypothetical protein
VVALPRHGLEPRRPTGPRLRGESTPGPLPAPTHHSTPWPRPLFLLEHTISYQPPPSHSGRLDAARAYRHVLALAAVGAGAPAWQALVALTGLLGGHPGTWTHAVETTANITAAAIGGVWLMFLVGTRPGRNLTPGSWWTTLGASAALLADNLDHTQVPGTAAGHLTTTIALAWLTCEVLRRDGITVPTGTWSDAHRAWSTATYLLVGTGMLMTLITLYAPGPVLHASQLATVGVTSHASLITASLWTSIDEEVVISAAAVLLLQAAGRPRREWVAVPVLIRLLPHLYLGEAALPVVLLGTGAALLVARYRSTTAITAIAGAHFLYDWNPAVAIWAAAVYGLVSLYRAHGAQRRGARPGEALADPRAARVPAAGTPVMQTGDGAGRPGDAP